MALHGEIKVNYQAIGEWEAVRVETSDPNVYQCYVAWNREGSPGVYQGGGHWDYAEREDFTIYHRHEDGALSLAIKVLTAADLRRARFEARLNSEREEGP